MTCEQTSNAGGSMDLDQLFGPMLQPQPNSRGVTCHKFEEDYRPLSLTILSKVSARQLKSFMDEIRGGFLAGKLLSNDVTIIWIADRNGDILYAVEELFYLGEPAGLPRFRQFPPTIGYDKLGHPSLVGGQAGRIGGEIYMDAEEERPYWIINNRSGRYGLHHTRKYIHLKNVANRFRTFGIELKISHDERFI